MITTLTLRDSTGRIKTFSKNQDFSAYENQQWKLGTGVDGKLVSYLEVNTDSHITLTLGDSLNNSFMIIYVNTGDFFTLEDEGCPMVNPLKPFV